MASVPTAERPPAGLTAYWLGAWRLALKTLKDQGTWALEQKPLLDEYIYALRAAEDARKGFKWLDVLEEYADENAADMPAISWTALRQIAGSLPTVWDKHSKRAAALADQLALTPRGRKTINLATDEDEDADPFDALDQEDELAARRKAS